MSIRTGIVMSKCFSFETVVNPETLLGGGLKCYCLSYVVAQSFHPCPSQTTWILKCSDFLLEKIQLWRPLSHFISYQLIWQNLSCRQWIHHSISNGWHRKITLLEEEVITSLILMESSFDLSSFPRLGGWLVSSGWLLGTLLN